MNPYDTLKIDKDATQAEIRKSYMELIEKYNPKKYLGDVYFAKRQLYKIQKAYTLLSNPKSKMRYDMKNLKHIKSSDSYSHYYSKKQSTDNTFEGDWNTDSKDIWEDASIEAWENDKVNNNVTNVNPIKNTTYNKDNSNTTNNTNPEKFSVFYIPIRKETALNILC